MIEQLRKYLEDHRDNYDEETKIFFGDSDSLEYLKLFRKLKNNSINSSVNHSIDRAAAERIQYYLDNTESRVAGVVENTSKIVGLNSLLVNGTYPHNDVQLNILINRDVYLKEYLENIDKLSEKFIKDKELEDMKIFLKMHSSCDAFQKYYVDLKSDILLYKLLGEFIDENDHLLKNDSQIRDFLLDYQFRMIDIINKYDYRPQLDLQEKERELIHFKELLDLNDQNI